MAPNILVSFLIFPFTSYPIHFLWPHLVPLLRFPHLSPYPSSLESDEFSDPLPASGTSMAKNKGEEAFLLSVWALLWQKPPKARSYECSSSWRPNRSRLSPPSVGAVGVRTARAQREAPQQLSARGRGTEVCQHIPFGEVLITKSAKSTSDTRGLCCQITCSRRCSWRGNPK